MECTNKARDVIHGFTSNNCNYAVDASKYDRIEIIASGPLRRDIYYFAVPKLYINVISDYLVLVQTAHPDADVKWTLLEARQ